MQAHLSYAVHGYEATLFGCSYLSSLIDEKVFSCPMRTCSIMP